MRWSKGSEQGEQRRHPPTARVPELPYASGLRGGPAGARPRAAPRARRSAPGSGPGGTAAAGPELCTCPRRECSCRRGVRNRAIVTYMTTALRAHRSLSSQRGLLVPPRGSRGRATEKVCTTLRGVGSPKNILLRKPATLKCELCFVYV